MRDVIVSNTPCMVYRIVLPLSFIGQKPTNPAYPTKLVTIGDHLRKVRLDRGLKQVEVAEILKTDVRNVFRWETTDRTPLPFLSKRVLKFIGYIPIDLDAASLAEQLYWARQVAGLSQEQAAKEIGVSEQTIVFTEKNNKIPKSPIIQSKVADFIYQYLVGKITRDVN